MTTGPAFPWRALNAALLVGLTVALLLGASIVWSDQARDTEQRAQQIHRLVSAGLELGRGSPQRLQALLTAVPAPPLFSGLELHGKAGRLAAVRYGNPLPGWLERWLPASRASAPEFPLDAKGSLVLRLVAAPPYARLLQAAPTTLAVVVFAVIFANLTAWLLRGRRYRASRSQPHSMPKRWRQDRWRTRAHTRRQVSPRPCSMNLRLPCCTATPMGRWCI